MTMSGMYPSGSFYWEDGSLVDLAIKNAFYNRLTVLNGMLYTAANTGYRWFICQYENQ